MDTARESAVCARTAAIPIRQAEYAIANKEVEGEGRCSNPAALSVELYAAGRERERESKREAERGREGEREREECVSQRRVELAATMVRSGLAADDCAR